MQNFNLLYGAFVIFIVCIFLDAYFDLSDFTFGFIFIVCAYSQIYAAMHITRNVRKILTNESFLPKQVLTGLAIATIAFLGIAYWGFLSDPFRIINTLRRSYHALPVGLIFLSIALFCGYVFFLYATFLYAASVRKK